MSPPLAREVAIMARAGVYSLPSAGALGSMPRENP